MPPPRNTLSTVLLAILVVGLAFFTWQYISLKGQLQAAEKTIGKQQINKKVLSFSELFITNVLQSGQAVSFDQRLQLENAVRDINDPKIYTAWQKFTNANDQAEIQQDFYNLFSLLLQKISP